MSGSEASANPYVGPRPLETGERLFGRDRECSEIVYLLGAERVVLLHSPSGAGKSSLIQAGLIPRLRERFDVWRPTRVGHPLADVMTGNRYCVSAMLGFEQGIPEGLRRTGEALAGMPLKEYVETRARRPGAPESVLLIFDQFEEVLTADPLALADKREFFAQLGELLAKPTIWALFSLREDYLAPLDPYARSVPTHLRNRYRIDLLTREAARDAIVRPAVGRTWTDEAADRLVRDLAIIKVQVGDGVFVEDVGPYVEPMQLQVVCRGLWERMPADDLSVDPEDVAAFGDVTQALANYYAAEVARIAADEREERAVREWVGGRLISNEGIRLLVMRRGEGFLPRLVDAHLVRADQRGGTVWYELAHDRLIEPVRADNAQWFQEHLHPVQVQAALWARQGRRPGLLLDENALADAEAWAAGQELVEPDLGFLAASREARAHERDRREAQAQVLRAAQELAQAEARARKRQRWFTWAVGLLGVVALAVAVMWYLQSVAAESSAQTAIHEAARAELEAARARDQVRITAVRESENDPTRQAALLRDLERPAESRQWESWATNVVNTPMAAAVLPFDTVVEFAPDMRTIYRETPEGPRLWRVEEGVGHALSYEGLVYVRVFSPDGARLALAPTVGVPRIWRTDGAGAPVSLAGHPADVKSMEFSADGSRLLTTAEDGSVRVSRTDDGVAVMQASIGREPKTAAFSRDGRSIVAVAGQELRVWQVEGGGEPVVLAGPTKLLEAWFSPDGSHILAKTSELEIWAWRADGTEAGVTLGTGAHLVSPDGRWLAMKRSGDGTLWQVDELKLVGGLGGGIEEFAFSPDSARLITGSENGATRLWRFEPFGEVSKHSMHQSPITAVAFSPVSRYVASGDDKGMLHIWSPDVGAVWLDTQEGIDRLSFSPDGTHVLTFGDQRTAKVWRVDGELAAVLETGERFSMFLGGFAAGGKHVTTVAGDAVRVWKFAPEPAFPFIRGVATSFSSDWQRIATKGFSVWRIGVETPVRLPMGMDDAKVFALSPDGSLLLTSVADGTAWLWRVDAGGEPIVLRGHPKEVSSLSLGFSADGRRAITGSQDGTVQVWQVEDGALLASQKFDGATSVALSPDGARAVISGWKGAMRVWRVDGGAEPMALTGYSGRVDNVAFSPDDQRVLGSSEKTVRVWQADGSGESVVLRGHQEEVKAAMFSPDGSKVMTLAESVRVWDVDGRRAPVILDVAAQSAAFSADSRRVVTVTWEDTRVWTLCTLEPCLDALWRGTSYCVPAEERVVQLGEDDEVAAKRAADCQARVDALMAERVYR